MVAAFAEAGIKYRPARAAEQAGLGQRDDPHRGVLLALVGEAGPGLRRPAHERDTLLFYAGLFTAWPRSADRLAAMLSEWMGHPVTVRQFEGAWLSIPISERSRLPKGRDRGQFTRLGHDVAIGERSWDTQGRVVIEIDGLALGPFHDLLPDRPDAARLLGLVRAYLGPATDFVINPIMKQDQVPGCALGGSGRLGWDTWLTAEPRRRGGNEARFPAGLIERKQMGRA
jgi:type VI secretion system protein ImpH